MSHVEENVIQPGWDVFSSDSERVGRVVDVAADRVEVELQVLGGRRFFVPLGDIESANDGEVQLDVSAIEIGQMSWEESARIR